MNTETGKSTGDDLLPDDEYTDTSVFNAEDIVNNLEARAKSPGNPTHDKGSMSRKQFEALQEEKRLREELRDLEDYEL